MMARPTNEPEFRRLTTPRAASAAGILFSLLFTASLVLLRITLPEGLSGGTAWLEVGAGRIQAALLIMPFAGITFLWFIGAVRDRLGELEDQFFATIFLGSGLVFLAMLFVSMAIVGGLVASYSVNPIEPLDTKVIFFGRAVMLQLSNVYALRMASVFMISLGTIWLRTGLMSRWVVILTFVLAAALLFIISLSLWVALIFPLWVTIISVVNLSLNRKKISAKERR